VPHLSASEFFDFVDREDVVVETDVIDLAGEVIAGNVPVPFGVAADDPGTGRATFWCTCGSLLRSVYVNIGGGVWVMEHSQVVPLVYLSAPGSFASQRLLACGALVDGYGQVLRVIAGQDPLPAPTRCRRALKPQAPRERVVKLLRLRVPHELDARRRACGVVVAATELSARPGGGAVDDAVEATYNVGGVGFQWPMRNEHRSSVDVELANRIDAPHDVGD